MIKAVVDSPQPFVDLTRDDVSLTRFEDMVGRLSTRADDYVNALVLNESGEVLILPAPDPHSGRVAWELVGGGVEPGEDPLTAVQRILQTHTGCVTNDWTYLSSYLTDLGCHVGVGHFFCAQKARQTVLPSAQTAASPIRAPQWIPLKELRYALLDGRVASISHAATISLALLTILK